MILFWDFNEDYSWDNMKKYTNIFLQENYATIKFCNNQKITEESYTDYKNWTSLHTYIHILRKDTYLRTNK